MRRARRTVGATNRRVAMHMRQTYKRGSKPQLPVRGRKENAGSNKETKTVREAAPRRPSTCRPAWKRKTYTRAGRRMSTGVYGLSPRTRDEPARAEPAVYVEKAAAESSESAATRKANEAKKRDGRVLNVLNRIKQTVHHKSSRKNTLLNVFRRFDADNSGSITSEEFSVALKSYLAGQKIQFDDDDCKYLVRKMDRDKDGTVDLPEFLNALKDDPMGLLVVKTGPETHEPAPQKAKNETKRVTFSAVLRQVKHAADTKQGPRKPIVRPSTAQKWFFPPSKSGWDIDERSRFAAERPRETRAAKVARGESPRAPWSQPGELARLKRISRNSGRMRRYCEALEKARDRLDTSRVTSKVEQRKRYFAECGTKYKLEALFQKRRFPVAPPSYKKTSIYDSSGIY